MMHSTRIGHHRWWELLERAVTEGRLAHAYLFSGPSHLGKTMFAHAFAERLLGAPLEGHADAVVLEPVQGEDTIAIDRVRSFVATLATSPLVAPYRVALIQDLSTLTVASWNLLLKTLEEPPAHAVILLVSDAAEQLPATVRSRIQHCRFVPVPRAELSRALMERGARRAEAELLAALAGGRPGLALRWLADPEALERYQSEAKAFVALLSAPLSARFAFTESVAKESGMSRTDLASLMNHWLLILRDLLISAVGEPGLVCHRGMLQLAEDGRLVARRAAVVRAVHELMAARRRVAVYGNRRLALNNFFLQLSL